MLEKGHIKQAWRIPGAPTLTQARPITEPTYRPNVFCEGNEDVPPPAKAPLFGSEQTGDVAAKFRWCLGDKSGHGNYLSEMHINI